MVLRERESWTPEAVGPLAAARSRQEAMDKVAASSQRSRKEHEVLPHMTAEQQADKVSR